MDGILLDKIWFIFSFLRDIPQDTRENEKNIFKLGKVRHLN